MLPWLILTFVLLLVITGLIIERAVSGYLNRKSLSELKSSFEALRTSQERGFAQLGLIQKDLFVALKLAYKAAERAYDLAREEMKLTNDKLGIPPTPTKKESEEVQSKFWPDVVGDKDLE